MMQRHQTRFVSSIKNNLVPATGSINKIGNPPSGGFFFGIISASMDLLSPVPLNILNFFIDFTKYRFMRPEGWRSVMCSKFSI